MVPADGVRHLFPEFATFVLRTVYSPEIAKTLQNPPVAVRSADPWTLSGPFWTLCGSTFRTGTLGLPGLTGHFSVALFGHFCGSTVWTLLDAFWTLLDTLREPRSMAP